MTLPRGYLTGTAIALVLAWLPYGLSPGGGLVAPMAQTVLYIGLAVLTARSRRLKILVVRTMQRWVINPVVRSLFAVGLNPQVECVVSCFMVCDAGRYPYGESSCYRSGVA